MTPVSAKSKIKIFFFECVYPIIPIVNKKKVTEKDILKNRKHIVKVVKSSGKEIKLVKSSNNTWVWETIQ